MEKPLTTTRDGTRQIADAMTESGHSVVVTFNYRYSPRNSALRQLIADGEIGTVTSVHFEWVLDTPHGADYFRRWHREKENSGGLLVHKASHHFDLVNWWIADVRTRVFASGGLCFYGDRNAAARGLGRRPERGTVDSPAAATLQPRPAPTSLDRRCTRKRAVRRLPPRPGRVRPGITIEDNLAAHRGLRVRRPARYSLNAHSPVGGLPRLGQRHRGPRRARGHRAGARVIDETPVRSTRAPSPSGGRERRDAPDLGAARAAEALGDPAVEVAIPAGRAATAAATRRCCATSSRARRRPARSHRLTGATASARSRSGSPATVARDRPGGHDRRPGARRRPVALTVVIVEGESDRAAAGDPGARLGLPMPPVVAVGGSKGARRAAEEFAGDRLLGLVDAAERSGLRALLRRGLRLRPRSGGRTGAGARHPRRRGGHRRAGRARSSPPAAAAAGAARTCLPSSSWRASSADAAATSSATPYSWHCPAAGAHSAADRRLLSSRLSVDLTHSGPIVNPLPWRP